jgi:hypothetical protein
LVFVDKRHEKRDESDDTMRHEFRNFMMMKKFWLLLLVLCIPVCLSAQGHTYKRKKPPLVVMDGHYKMSGWHFAPGLSYTFTRFKNSAETLYQGNDTLYTGTFDPAGKLGLYFEAGRYRLFKYGVLFNYMDYGVAFKQIKGKEAFAGEIMRESSSSLISAQSAEGLFKHSYITGNFNLNGVLQTSDYQFVQWSLGLNADYQIINKTSYTGSTAFMNQATNGKFMAQAHFKLGYGFKWTDKLFIIPTLETPILTFYKWDGFQSVYPMFSSKYRPVFLTIRFTWLQKPKNDDCPTGISHPDDKKKQQQYQQESR